MEIAVLKAAVKEASEPLYTRIGALEDQNKAVQKALDDKTLPFESRMKALEDALAARKAPSMPGLKEEIAKRRGTDEAFSFCRLAKAQITRRKEDAPFELDVIAEFSKLAKYDSPISKALSTDVNTLGGFLVPMEAAPEFIELLRAMEVTSRLGATVISGLKSSPVPIPKQSAGATAYWLGENAAISPSNLTFAQVLGHTRKCAALVVASRELIMQGVPSVDGIIRRDLATQIALARDLAALKGSGISNQPLGIYNFPGKNTNSLATCTMEKLMSSLLELEKDNAAVGKLGWAFNPVGWDKIRKLKDSEGQFFLRPDATTEESKRLLGYPVAVTTQLSDGDCIVGNWADLAILEWGAMEFRASEETSDAFAKDQVWIRGIMLTDVVGRHDESFCVSTDLS